MRCRRQEVSTYSFRVTSLLWVWKQAVSSESSQVFVFSTSGSGRRGAAEFELVHFLFHHPICHPSHPSSALGCEFLIMSPFSPSLHFCYSVFLGHFSHYISLHLTVRACIDNIGCYLEHCGRIKQMMFPIFNSTTTLKHPF